MASITKLHKRLYKKSDEKDVRYSCDYYAFTNTGIFHVNWKTQEVIITNSSNYEIIRKDGEDVILGITVSVHTSFWVLLPHHLIKCEGGYAINVIYNAFSPLTTTEIKTFIINKSTEEQSEY